MHYCINLSIFHVQLQQYLEDYAFDPHQGVVSKIGRRIIVNIVWQLNTLKHLFVDRKRFLNFSNYSKHIYTYIFHEVFKLKWKEIWYKILKSAFKFIYLFKHKLIFNVKCYMIKIWLLIICSLKHTKPLYQKKNLKLYIVFAVMHSWF